MLTLIGLAQAEERLKPSRSSSPGASRRGSSGALGSGEGSDRVPCHARWFSCRQARSGQLSPAGRSRCPVAVPGVRRAGTGERPPSPSSLSGSCPAREEKGGASPSGWPRVFAGFVRIRECWVLSVAALEPPDPGELAPSHASWRLPRRLPVSTRTSARPGASRARFLDQGRERVLVSPDPPSGDRVGLARRRQVRVLDYVRTCGHGTAAPSAPSNASAGDSD